METNKELEQLHQGCYLDQLFLYGGIMKNDELVGAKQENNQDLWFNIGLVKLTPMETSRMKGARVVQIPLHTRYIEFIILRKLNKDTFSRLVLNNQEEEDDPVIMYLNIKADLHQSFWTLKKAKFFLIEPHF